MAIAEWLKVEPNKGSGNANVNVSSNTPHTGRLARQPVLTWEAANVQDTTRRVIQAGKKEYVDIDDQAASTKEGKVVTIYGVSNSAKLTFSLGTGDLEIALPATYLANSLTTNNGAAITGDIGATQEYPFSIAINVPANDGVDVKSKQIIVEDEAGHQDVCLFTLAAGEPYVTVAEGDIELDYLGTPVQVSVQSNTTWTIE